MNKSEREKIKQVALEAVKNNPKNAWRAYTEAKDTLSKLSNFMTPDAYNYAIRCVADALGL